jgi:hypothetical protein
MDEKVAEEDEEITFYRCNDCDKNYKTYQGLYNHNKRNHFSGTDGDMTPITTTKIQFDKMGYKFGKFGRTKAGESVKQKREKKVLKKVEEITAKEEGEKPSYLSDEHDFENEIEAPDSIPNFAHILEVSGDLPDDEESRLSKTELKFQGKLARQFYIMMDSLLTTIGKGYTGDESYEIIRNKADYDLLENSTVAMMEEQQLRIPYSATTNWAITLGIAYSIPAVSMVNKRKKNGKRILPRFKLFRRRKRNENEEN